MFLRENDVGRRIAPHLGRGQTLLDLGAGTGYMSRWLKENTGVVPTLTDLVKYRNLEKTLPFITQRDPLRVPVADDSFDVVMLLFVFHHMDEWTDQEVLLDEAIRIARRRLIILEDTPESRVDLYFNMFWDRVLNWRHGVPTPFTFRSTDKWLKLFKSRDLSIVYSDTYRAMWPTLKTYHNSLFVLDL